MHKTTARWEAGEIPDKELIGRVGKMLGQLAEAKLLLAGEGLRPSSEGARVRFSGGQRSVVLGPFEGRDELPAGFSIIRSASLDEAIEWASRQAEALGDGEVDIRPVTEPWDIGMGSQPATISTRRFMVLRKATPKTEAGTELTSQQRARLSALVAETTRTGVHLASETMRPSRRGRRYKNSRDGISGFDGPFVETKELIAGYVIVAAGSLEEAGTLARSYIDAVGAHEVDVRELE
jgi:hypothetical protein